MAFEFRTVCEISYEQEEQDGCEKEGVVSVPIYGFPKKETFIESEVHPNDCGTIGSSHSGLCFRFLEVLIGLIFCLFYLPAFQVPCIALRRC
jgi:hypothetical protein